MKTTLILNDLFRDINLSCLFWIFGFISEFVDNSDQDCMSEAKTQKSMVNVLQATEITDVAERTCVELLKGTQRQQGEYDSLIDEMRQATRGGGGWGAEVFVPIPANIWLTQTSKSTKTLCMRVISLHSSQSATAGTLKLYIFTQAPLIVQLPSCCSRLLLHCFFFLVLYRIPCRDMDNDSLLLTSAKHQIAQRYASKLGSAWSNQTCQADIYKYAVSTASTISSTLDQTGPENHHRFPHLNISQIRWS